MVRKAKTKVVRKVSITKAKLIDTIRDQEQMLAQAKNLMDAMQTEIKQLTQMHRTQLQIIQNLSENIKDN